MNDSSAFPVEAYLRRIGLAQLPAPTAAGLAQLVRAQLHGIAFENLDVLAGEEVAVDLPAVCAKILARGRGGYCFELNALLAEALRVAGFEIELRMSRVSFGRPAPGPRTHLLMVVRIDGEQWLADAGFGGPAPFGTVPVRANECFAVEDREFRFLPETGGQLHLQSREPGTEWENVYCIDPGAVLPLDVEMANHFVSTWPRSPFRRMFMVQRQGPDSVCAIDGLALITRERLSDATLRRRLEGATDLRNVLANVFGISASDGLASRAWSRASEYGDD